MSSALVASSSSRIGAFFRIALASARRWRWPARQPQAAVADHRVVALRLRHDELVRGGGLGGGDDLLVVGVEATQRDVGADGVVEQRHLLADDGDRLPETGDRHLAQVLAVDEDAPGIHVEQPRHQVDHGRLAGAGAADQRHRLAAGYRQRQALHGLRAVRGGIGKADVVEDDGALPYQQRPRIAAGR